MTIRKINPAALGPEPPSYSHAVEAQGANRIVYVAGQVGTDEQGNASPEFATQTRQVWRNIEAILDQAGMSLRDIVKTTTFLVDRADFAQFATVRKEFLRDHKPASTLVFVSGLVKVEWRVEVEVVAVRE